ncbi:MAG: O-antigen translocase [Fibrobacterales bacterium]|nr:O-antigen translocase [Fibrobacterales bacterium]
MKDGAGFWKVVCGSGGVTAVRALCAVAANKALALALGPSLFASVAQFQNLLAIGQSASSLGLQNGWVALTARSKDDPDRLAEAWRGGVLLACLGWLALSAALAAFAFAAPLETLFPGVAPGTARAALLLSVPGILCANAAAVCASAMNGLRRFALWGAAGILSPVLQLLWLVAFLDSGEGLVLAALATQSALPAAVSAALALKAGFSPRAWLRAKRAAVREWLDFAGMGIVPAVCGPLAAIAVRQAAGGTLGWDRAGLLQGCWRISDFFSLGISSALGVWLLPRLAANADSEPLWTAVRPALGRAMLLALAGAAFVAAFRSELVPLLFSDSFAGMEELLPLQLAGDVLRSGGWCLGLGLVARRKTKLFVSAEVLSQLFFAALAVGLMPALGLRAPLLAYAAENGLYLAALLVAVRRTR